jgi:hypothetical protein
MGKAVKIMEINDKNIKKSIDISTGREYSKEDLLRLKSNGCGTEHTGQRDRKYRKFLTYQRICGIKVFV